MDSHYTWGIVGCGFGLYGYLPALSRLGQTSVLIRDKHLPFLQSRDELKTYASRVWTVASTQEILAQSDSLIFAVPPMAQEQMVQEWCLQHTYQHLVLEKPVATSPAQAHHVLQAARQMCGSLRVGYTFLYTDWGQTLRNWHAGHPLQHCEVKWHFSAHHFRPDALPSWKTDHGLGGGALRFYGIHLIAYFASLGCETVENSHVYCTDAGTPVTWKATLTAPSGLSARIELQSNSSNKCFEIVSKDAGLKMSMEHPFAIESHYSNEDARVPILERMLRGFDSADADMIDLYQRVNRLWDQAEQVSVWPCTLRPDLQ